MRQKCSVLQSKNGGSSFYRAYHAEALILLQGFQSAKIITIMIIIRKWNSLCLFRQSQTLHNEISYIPSTWRKCIWATRIGALAYRGHRSGWIRTQAFDWQLLLAGFSDLDEWGSGFQQAPSTNSLKIILLECIGYLFSKQLNPLPCAGGAQAASSGWALGGADLGQTQLAGCVLQALLMDDSHKPQQLTSGDIYTLRWPRHKAPTDLN